VPPGQVSDVFHFSFYFILSLQKYESIHEHYYFYVEMSIIKNHLQIELTIDNILYRLRLRHISEMKSSPLPPRPHLETRSTSLLTLPTRNATKSNSDDDANDVDNVNTVQKITTYTTNDIPLFENQQQRQNIKAKTNKMSDKVLRTTKRGLWMTSNNLK
jgi:hypothetical protein